MKKIVWLSCGLVLALLFSCENIANNVATPVVSGVSLELAKERKSLLSHIKYDLSVNITGDVKDAVVGKVIISFYSEDNKLPLQLDFEEKDNHVKSIKVNQVSATVEQKNEHIIIPNTLLMKGVNNIEIEFSSNSPALYKNDNVLYSLFVPARARSFMPCFDQPDLKACFTLTAIVPEGWTVISNGKTKEALIKEKFTKFSFETSDTLSTYLFSIVAGKFKKQTRVIRGREFNFYYREEDTSKVNASVDSIFILHDYALSFMEKYTGIPMPFKKFDFVALQSFPYGGMEHVGAIDYNASVLFLGRSATESEKNERASTIAHETAHMWFGNLVTMKWFNDVWMKEVFANFMADKIINSFMPDKNEDYRFMLKHHPAAYYVDRTEGTHAIRQELDNLDQAKALYGYIIYNKAPIVMRQLERIVGKDVLQEALRKYLKNYAFDNSEWPDLISILDTISKENVTEWNDQWINGKGRPTLTYSVSSKAGTISTFRINQVNQQNAGVMKQYFSIALVYKDGIKIIPVYMNEASVILTQAENLPEPLFILFNATGEGYGKFPVDKKMLDHMDMLKRPVMRASAYINLYENVLDGQVISPSELLRTYSKNLSVETEKLLITRMLKQFNNVYWQFITPEQRALLSENIEVALWQAMQGSTGTKKRELFQAYSSIAISNQAIDRLYKVWNSETPPSGVLLEEEDYNLIATEIAIRKHKNTEEILLRQMARIKDPERKAQFRYVLPSLSNDILVRDVFFDSLANKNNKRNETWIIKAIGHLYHPLRLKDSEKYIPKTLSMLEELQKTRGVFFSSDWLMASLDYFQSKTASRAVRDFLNKNPNYNKRLKSKILQEADDLFRASKLLGI